MEDFLFFDTPFLPFLRHFFRPVSRPGREKISCSIAIPCIVIKFKLLIPFCFPCPFFYVYFFPPFSYFLFYSFVLYKKYFIIEILIFQYFSLPVFFSL